jgi:hypothetical protein
MDPMLKSRAEGRDAAAEWTTDRPEPANPPADPNDPEVMRRELDRLRQRENQIMSLIGCKSSEKLMHDLRNVLNELQLLRMLAETDKS